jgi:hypothetical protein
VCLRERHRPRVLGVGPDGNSRDSLCPEARIFT